MDTFKINFGVATDPGLVREHNEDSYGRFPEQEERQDYFGDLFIVADGLGGHNAGQIASGMAINIIGKTYFDATSGTPGEKLLQAFRQANDEIQARADGDADYSGMATTCTALAFRDGKAYIVHIGDSRAYRINKYLIEQVTTDHSQVAEMQRQGILTKEEAEAHPERSVLTRALGTKSDVEIDVIDDIPFEQEDKFLLCTDGLSKITEKELKKTVVTHPPKLAAQKLVEMANERGGEDNSTALIIQIGSPKNFKVRFLRLFGKE